jgi:hypothetical protein
VPLLDDIAAHRRNDWRLPAASWQHGDGIVIACPQMAIDRINALLLIIAQRDAWGFPESRNLLRVKALAISLMRFKPLKPSLDDRFINSLPISRPSHGECVGLSDCFCVHFCESSLPLRTAQMSNITMSLMLSPPM